MPNVKMWDNNHEPNHSLFSTDFTGTPGSALKVWIYSGQTTSDTFKELFTVPSVLTVHEYQHYFDATFMFFYQDQWITLKQQQAKTATRYFSGRTEDSRGFEIEWLIKVSGDEITGSYKIDFDHGSLHLNLVSLQQSEPINPRLVNAAT